VRCWPGELRKDRAVVAGSSGASAAPVPFRGQARYSVLVSVTS
jgi:hypothetical protein